MYLSLHFYLIHFIKPFLIIYPTPISYLTSFSLDKDKHYLPIWLEESKTQI